MGVRDLGHRPYEGERRAPSANTWVLVRHALRRALASWFVRVALIFGWIPSGLAIFVVAIQGSMAKSAIASNPDAARMVEDALGPGSVLRAVLGWQFWLFLTLLSLGSGATAIARDLETRALRFYLAKPVTPAQYLASRIAAVTILGAVLLFVPSVLFVVGASAVLDAPAHLALVFPAALHAVLVAGAMATLSIGVSAASSGRAVTMGLWAALLVVPHGLAEVAARTGEWPRARLASIPSLLSTVSDAIFRVTPASGLPWTEALPALALLLAGGAAFAYRRVCRAEVIA